MKDIKEDKYGCEHEAGELGLVIITFLAWCCVIGLVALIYHLVMG